MAIAANFRKHPEAMALQLVLVFTRFVWHTSRPTTRAGRAIRAAVGRAFKAAPKVVYPVKPTTPQWARDLGRLVRKLGQSVKDAQIFIDFYQSNGGATTTGAIWPSAETLARLNDDHQEPEGPEFFSLF